MAAAEAEPAEAELLHFAAVGDNGGVQSLLKAGGRINAVVRTAPWASATSVRSTARSDWKRAITRTKLGQAAGGARTKLNARPAARPAASRSTAAPKAGKNRQRDRAAWLRKAESDAKSAARKRGTPGAWEELMIEMPPHLLIEARRFVTSVPMFEGLDGAFVNMLAKGLEAKEFQPGEILFEKGSEGDDMFFVREGSVDVLLDLDDPPVATRGKDTFFGEVRVLLFPVPAQRCSLANPEGLQMALLDNSTRNAHIRADAETGVQCYALSKPRLDEVFRRFPGMQKRLSPLPSGSKLSDGAACRG